MRLQRRVLLTVGGALLAGSVLGTLPRVPETSAAEPAPTTISVVGTGLVPVPVPVAGHTAALGVAQRATSENLDTVVVAVRDKVAALRSALAANGIDGTAIRSDGLSIAPGGGRLTFTSGEASDTELLDEPGAGPSAPPVTSPTPAPPAGITPPPAPSAPPFPPVMPPLTPGYMVSEQLRAEVTDADKLVAVIQAANKVGASVIRVSRSSSPIPTTADPTLLASGIARATEQAKGLAQASAQATGQNLSGIRSLTVGVPTYGPTAGGSVAWRVTVTLVYDVSG